MGYFTTIIYFLLELLGTTINFICSLLHFYPGFEWGQSFVMSLSLRKERKSRFKLQQKAEGKMEEAWNNDAKEV